MVQDFRLRPRPELSQQGYSISLRTVKKRRWPSVLAKRAAIPWLKLKRKRRNWGPDWWEDDFYFGTEWMSNFPVDLQERATTEYWESVFEDFSQTPPRFNPYSRYTIFQHKRLVTYKQPLYLKRFYKRYLEPVYWWLLRNYGFSFLGTAMAHQELKHSVGRIGGMFWWLLWPYSPYIAWLRREKADDIYAGLLLYIFHRAEVLEKPGDYLLIDTAVGRIGGLYFQRVFNLIGRVFFDLKNVPVFSVWLDIVNRGFSPHMLMLRWRYYHKWLRFLGYPEFFFACVASYLYFLKKHNIWTAHGFGKVVVCAFFAVQFANFLEKNHQIMDIWIDAERDAVHKFRDKQKDPEIEDLLDPPDTHHTHVSDPFDVAFIAQDPVYFPSRQHYNASLLTSSWWFEANGRLSHFVYHADRDWLLLERDDKVMFFYFLCEKIWPGSVDWCFKWKVPGFRNVDVLNNQFAWWMRWRYHIWTRWSTPLRAFPMLFRRFPDDYEWFKGILRYSLDYARVVMDDQFRQFWYDLAHEQYDEMAEYQDAIDDFEDRIWSYPYTRRPHTGWYAKINKRAID